MLRHSLMKSGSTETVYAASVDSDGWFSSHQLVATGVSLDTDVHAHHRHPDFTWWFLFESLKDFESQA